jgi:hypothetical protein
MIRSTVLTLVKQQSTWAITSKTSLTTPNDTPWSTHGQGWVKTLVKPLKHTLTLVSSGTFTAFSKFSLNTSNSPNTKVGYFHVEWHCWFEMQMGENLKSTLLVTVHRHPENSQLGIQFVQKWLRKRPYALNQSCRGIGDLPLCCCSLGPLLLKNLEKNWFKQCQVK